MIDAYSNEWNKEIVCDYCNHAFKIKAEKGVTYKGIDEHHNPPKFMFEENEKWVGELLNLCRKHHRELHDEIIKILNEEVGTLKFVNSEHWVWIKMSINDRKKARERVYTFTKKWIKENNEDGDTDSKTD